MERHFTPTHYTSHVGHMLATKNKLEEAIVDYLCSIDRQLIPAAALSEYKKQVQQQIEKLCNKYPRCKPVTISFWNPTRTKDQHLTGFGTCRFSIHACEEIPTGYATRPTRISLETTHY